MSLINALNRFQDVTDSGVVADPDARRGTRPPVRPGWAGTGTNRAGFSAAIAALRTRRPGTGTLYVPPGRYLIEVEPTIADNWHKNLWQRSRIFGFDSVYGEIITRIDNQFGASLRIPDRLTLWLAAGAVLVPARGCVIDISSTLVCEATECFDLSLGGLVVFGTRVPIVRPEWWGVEGVDHTPAVQAAIDAAIHNRAIGWELPWPPRPILPIEGITHQLGHYGYSRPPLGVELRGTYRIAGTLEACGDPRRNGIVATLAPPDAPTANGVADPGSNTATVISGAWSGRSRQGAALVASSDTAGIPLFRVIHGAGLTVRGVSFEASGGGYRPCVELRASTREFDPALPRPTSPYAAAQCIGFRACRFAGSSTPLVQVGAPVVIESVGDTTHHPRARWSYGGSDFSLLTFDECEFLPSAGGVGVDIRAQQTLPTRFRRCDFVGHAEAMMSLWDGTQHLEGCYFHNQNERVPAKRPSSSQDSFLRGYELPDNTDIFLRIEYPTGTEASPEYTQGDNLSGLTAIGCVSRSRSFLSTVSPSALVGQQHETPVLLLNVRHLAPPGTSVPSVQWGLQNHASERISRQDELPRQMSLGAPLVIVGGWFSRPIRVMRGAVQSAVVGARVPGAVGAGVVELERPILNRTLPRTDVFGLLADQPNGIR
jgi:hypothetical protein